MLMRVIVLAGVLAAAPAFAGPMNADEARRFVIGKLFSFNCFEGTSGAGRVHADGSVSGMVRFGGAAGARYVTLPPGTLRVRGEAVCGVMGSNVNAGQGQTSPIGSRNFRAASSCRSAPSATKHKSTSLSCRASRRACEPNR